MSIYVVIFPGSMKDKNPKGRGFLTICGERNFLLVVIPDYQVLAGGGAEKASDDSVSGVAAMAQGAAVRCTAKFIPPCTCLLFTEAGLPSSLGLLASALLFLEFS